MNPEHWFTFGSGTGHFDFNMALDEALLEAMPRLGRPVLRFYGWFERAASFGYFQRYSDVEELTELRPLVRRPTGGGIVPHYSDWTYSLAFPTTHEWYSVPAVESYRRVHQWLQESFEHLGVPTELATQPNKTRAGQCFAGFERFDLLWQGRKIAGAAQRRRRDGLLIQGSVQPPAIPSGREQWEVAMRAAAESRRHVRWTEFKPEPWLITRAEELARTKYSRTAYNRRR